MKENICIIPASGGSKRIPRKNIKNFCGKPVIAWSILNAINSKCFDEIIVSTDDEEIAEVSKKFGAKVPFMRPKNLSDDHTETISVIKHAIEWLRQGKKYYKYVCCLYATAPLVEPCTISDSLNRLIETGSEYSFPITNYPYHIERALKLTSENTIEMFEPSNFHKRSQDLVEAFHDVGQFYWGKESAWLEEKIIFEKHSIPLIIKRDKVQDIDNLEDWRIAEKMFLNRN
tara:strand:- start:89 stop:778 length:690 start_codon:yes stop_codon:yes gene_type:complete